MRSPAFEPRTGDDVGTFEHFRIPLFYETGIGNFPVFLETGPGNRYNKNNNAFYGSRIQAGKASRLTGGPEEKEEIYLNQSAAEFLEGLSEKKIGIIGVGVSHFELIRLFLRKGAAVTVLDRRNREELGEDYEVLAGEGARFRLGEGYLQGLENYDLVFRSPGMYFNHPALTAARQNGAAVVSEMEVFFALCPCRIFAVTGSDGKTTTSTLISEFLKAEGKQVHLGGNIGRALLPEIEQIRPEDVCVVELSSFQLISMRRSPDVAVITNISPNHLDVHGTMEEYVDAKKNILWHQDGCSRAVLNLDNPPTAALAPLVRGSLSWFSRMKRPERGAFLDGEGWLWRCCGPEAERLLHQDEIRIPGMHNVENYLTAISAVGQEVSIQSIQRVAREFGGVEHRIEFVRELEGVRYYNDSIASSPTRTMAGLDSFRQKIIVIAGGYDKKIPYAPLAPKLLEKAKAVVLMGATAARIEEALRECPGFAESGIRLAYANTMEEAVQAARSLACPGDIVSLSPASASFDLYRNFEERGRHFKSIVRGL